MIYVTGKNGQLGIELQKLAALKNAIFLDHSQLDLSDLEMLDIFLKNTNISCLINTAAYTQVDKAESEYELAYKINCEAPGIMARFAAQKNFKFIHYSTDYVFNGNGHLPYVETDPTDPVNLYGKSKLEGEKLILRENPDALIIRTSWLYSSSGKNFMKTILRLSSEKQLLNVVSDQIGTPTWAKDLADVTLLALDSGISGVFHYSNEGVTSWHEFAREIVRISQRSTEVLPIPSSGYPTPAARPAFSVLNKSKIKSTLNITIPDWKESLEKCMSELKDIK